MKVGIFCGIATSAQRKAQVYQDAIINCGHEVRIFSRGPICFWSHRAVINPDLGILCDKAMKADLDFFIGCNDNLGDVVSGLNAMIGLPHIPYGATHKTSLGQLSQHLTTIPTWQHIDEVPSDIPIFIKPNNGSGSVGGEPWSYKQFDSVSHFKQFLDTIQGGYSRFEYAEKNLGVLGKSVFQQHIPNEGYMYHHYLNDGTAQHWMETFCQAPNPHTPTTNKIHNVDRFGFLHNIPDGTFCAFQAFPNPDGLPMLFDFNVRCGAYWTTLYKHISPTFFDVYFNNYLNRGNDKYEFNCEEFTMDPHGPEWLMVEVADFPASGIHSMQAIIRK